MYRFHVDYENENGQSISCDIADVDYAELIDVCFRYCSIFTFTMAKDSKLRIPQALKPLATYRHPEAKYRYSDRKEVCIYPCNDETKACLLSEADSLFDWVSCWGNHRPDDLCFYRKDGTGFFISVTHESECWIYNRADEDVSSVVSKLGWWFVDRDSGYYVPLSKKTLSAAAHFRK